MNLGMSALSLTKMQGALRPIFDAPLTKSLVPGVATGSATPTFSRATAAYVQDHEGIMRLAAANEARFTGARRVANLCLNSQDNTQTTSPNVSNVTRTATHVQYTAANNAYFYKRTINLSYPAGTVVSGSAYVRSTDGRVNIGFRVNASDGSVSSVVVVPLTSTYQRVSLTVTLTGTIGMELGIDNRSAVIPGVDTSTTGTVDITNWQLEDVTGQSVQTPSEYVSTGVLSAPYQGANVNGVQYFDTVRLHTQNAIAYSADLSQANWGKSNCSVVGTPVVAYDGSLTAWKVLDNAVNTQHVAFQSAGGLGTIAAGAQVTWSFDVQKVDYNFVAAQVVDGGFASGFFCVLDLSNPGVISSNGSFGTTVVAPISSSVAPLGNGWYRLSVTGYFTISTAPICEIIVGDNASANGHLGTGTKGTNFSRMQARLSTPSYISTYVPTTTTAVGPTDTGSTAAIPSSTLLGFYTEGAGAQLVTPTASIRDLTNAAWVSSGGTMTRALSQIGVDGAPNTATLLTATGANAVLMQAATVQGSAAFNCSFFIKRVSGSGSVAVTIDGGATWAEWGGSINAATFTRCYKQQTLANPQIGIRIATSGDVVAVDFSQLEATPVSQGTTSPMASSGASRNADLLQYVGTGNFSDTAGSAYCEFSYPSLAGTPPFYLAEVNNSGVANEVLSAFGSSGATQALQKDGTTTLTTTGGTVLPAATAKKAASSWGAGTMSVTVTGGTLASGSYDGSFNSSGNLQIGTFGSTTGQPSNCMRNIRIYGTKVSDAALNAMVA